MHAGKLPLVDDDAVIEVSAEWKSATCDLFNLSTPEAVFDRMCEMAKWLDYEHCSLTAWLPTAIEGSSVREYRFTTFPKGWEDLRKTPHNPLTDTLITRPMTGLLPQVLDRGLRWSHVIQSIYATGLYSGAMSAFHHDGIVVSLGWGTAKKWEEHPQDPNYVLACLKFHGKIVARVMGPLCLPRMIGQEPLSGSELDVLRMAAAGFSVEQTAKLLHCSEPAVNKWRSSATKKLGAANTLHATVLANGAGLFMNDKRNFPSHQPSMDDAAA
ncbi:helix-turn-helix domain-containing protein [Noviherbaspirillum galbum]|uniref:Helix-turn-helix transcriptional regulator n=1 Tax=Noviherbaspirillum galbum TaxID=2709383 RepID=A0A6B3SXX7_9BURK|nr:helix-turn-helix transcriptional regulator [Noviherbaspirillum galbum]NEX63422.1 helix-turn-helix transcriptional regulator [Noviherbaspirillum galbum]